MPKARAGASNLITDIPGLRIGQAHDTALRSGVTVLLSDTPVAAAVDIRGGGTGSRELSALSLSGSVEKIHGLVLSGGSAFGLNAATGVQSYLAKRNIGFQIGAAHVPIVPQAVLFDLLNGGDKNWGEAPPYETLARRACAAASPDFSLGSSGAGFGATTADCKGGIGSASLALENGLMVGVLAAVNAAGSATVGSSRHFWAAPFELDEEYGGYGLPDPLPGDAHEVRLKGGSRQNTTLGIVATNARLGRAELHRLAVMAQTGLAKALWPVHTPLDGDVVFAISCGALDLENPFADLAELGGHAANAMARAIARGVYEAQSFGDAWRDPPSHREMHG